MSSANFLTKFRKLNITPVGGAVASSELSKEQQAYSAQWNTVLKTSQVRQNLDQLNLFLRDHSFLLATSQPTELDVELFEAVFPLSKELVSGASSDVLGKYRHVLRWVDFLQKLLEVPSGERLVLNYDLELPREIIEKKKKKKEGDDKPTEAVSESKDDGEAQKSAAKKEKKGKKDDKQPRGKPDEETLKRLREEAKAKKAAKKAAAAAAAADAAKDATTAAAAEGPKPSAIDFRVGFIQKAIKHPNADSLYVSTIDVGDEEGPRTVCSGLVKHFPLEAMQERYVVVVCNLKPVNMRGIKSTAMVLCGSNEEKVEFVEPPKGSKAGDKVFFEGFGDEEPMKQLNPKKKIWETLQPHFTTNENLEVVFKDGEEKPLKLTNAKGESFKVASIVNAQVR